MPQSCHISIFMWGPTDVPRLRWQKDEKCLQIKSYQEGHTVIVVMPVSFISAPSRRPRVYSFPAPLRLPPLLYFLSHNSHVLFMDIRDRTQLHYPRFSERRNWSSKRCVLSCFLFSLMCGLVAEKWWERWRKETRRWNLIHPIQPQSVEDSDSSFFSPPFLRI